MTIKSTPLLLSLATVLVLSGPSQGQTTTTQKGTTNDKTTKTNPTTNSTTNPKSTKSKTNPFTNRTAKRRNNPKMLNGGFISGKLYAVTSAQKTLHFAGKEVVLPQGVQFQFQDGFLLIKLPQDADRSVAVVRLGKTYLIVTKQEDLAIDPAGIPRTPNRVLRRPRRVRPLRKGRVIRTINDAPDASPIRP